MKTLFGIGVLFLLPLFGRINAPVLSVSGTVRDGNTGQTISGVHIQVLGSLTSTISNDTGFYQLTLDHSGQILLFSHQVYQTQKRPVTMAGILDIFMIPHGSEHNPEEKLVIADIPKPTGLPPQVRAYSMHQSPVTPSYWNTEDYSYILDNTFIHTHDQSLSTFSADVDRASYTNVRRFLLRGEPVPADAVRIEEMINYFDYSYPTPQKDEPLSMHVELGNCPWNEDHRLLLIGLSSEKVETSKLPPSHLVFLIDVSGSMYSPEKLPLVQSSFQLLVNQLRPQDRISLVTYAGSSAVLLRGETGNNREKILEVINSLQAGGSTAGAEGIHTAYALAREFFQNGGNNRVILATDGDFNVGASSDGELVRLIEKQRESGVYLSVFGFGMGNYKDNKLQQLAGAGNGNHYYIDQIAEAKKVLIDEFGATMLTVAKDVKIQVEFNPAVVTGYRLIGYENRKLENRDFQDDKKDAGEIGSGHQVTVLYEIIPNGIQSPWLTAVDRRYTRETGLEKENFSDEWGILRIRYKSPENDEIRQMEKIIPGITEKISRDFYWASAVAGFGMLLRDSEFKQGTTLGMVKKLMDQGKGDRRGNQEQDFQNLVELWENLEFVDIPKGEK